MSTPSFYLDFLAYDRWANHRAAESLRGMADAGDGLRLLAHIVGSQEIWIRRILGGDYGALPVWPELTLDECVAAIDPLNVRWSDLVAGGTQDPGRIIAYTTQAGVPYETSIGDILAHVNNHGTYHRGQIARFVKAQGGVPAWTDFILYARERRSGTPLGA